MKLDNIVATGMVVLFATACSKTSNSSSSTDDSSASGAAVAMVGGALSTSASGGTVAFYGRPDPLKDFYKKGSQWILPDALAAVCPRPNSPGSSCSASGGDLWLTDSNCSHNNSSAIWNGITLLSLSSGSATCGSFPSINSGTLLRQYVTASGQKTPGVMTRINARGVTVNIDDATSNLGNFNGDTITTLGNGGYGTLVTFSGGARSRIDIAKREYVTNGFDHSVVGHLTVTETGGASSRTLNGTVTVYHNKMKVIGNAVFTNVTHSNTCCTPVSGTIQTTFSAGSVTPTLLGAAIVGKSETLTITGCGTGNLTSADGTSTVVTMNNCF
jgi:hypothetical protein